MTASPSPTPAIWLRSWIYLVLFVTWTVVYGTACLPALLRPSWSKAIIRVWVKSIMWLARTVVNITCRVEGLENIPAGPCVIAAQHQASFETYHLWIDILEPVFVLKRELIVIPLVGWFIARSGLVPIDRAAGPKAMRQTLRAAQKALSTGHQLVIFPEGTRAPAGVVKEFKPGVAALYLHCDAPLIPMALNSGALWGKTRILKMPGVIVFRFLPEIPKGLDREAFIAELRVRIESANQTMSN